MSLPYARIVRRDLRNREVEQLGVGAHVTLHFPSRSPAFAFASHPPGSVLTPQRYKNERPQAGFTPTGEKSKVQ